LRLPGRAKEIFQNGRWEAGPGSEAWKNFLRNAKKGFRLASKPVTIRPSASFDRPVFAGEVSIKIIEIQEEKR
jgi:hypothetical protein